jgi:CcmD family protein
MTWWKRLLVVAVGFASSAGAVFAQAQDGFVPATNITQESLPAGPLVYTAYAIVWLVLIAYLFLLWSRLGKVEKELREVAARLDRTSRT